MTGKEMNCCTVETLNRLWFICSNEPMGKPLLQLVIGHVKIKEPFWSVMVLHSAYLCNLRRSCSLFRRLDKHIWSMARLTVRLLCTRRRDMSAWLLLVWKWRRTSLAEACCRGTAYLRWQLPSWESESFNWKESAEDFTHMAIYVSLP